MSHVKSLRKHLDTMLGDIRRRLEPPAPSYGLILYEPIEEVECGEQKMSQVAYHARIAQEQPAVRTRLEELPRQGVHVWVWMPETA